MTVHDEILSKLAEIEHDHNVTIVLAIESGSRAWGFPSVDSDYDVRFIYVHKPDRYLSIESIRDVIELPIDPVFDVNGWDIRKALQLLRKSNISLLEWISSPIQYRCSQTLFEILQAIVPHGFRSSFSARHYLSMARSNMARIQADTVKMKAYLYAIRPLLCCRWVLDHNSQPPMLFRYLVASYLSGTALDDVISELIARKESQTEADTVPKNELLNAFITDEFARLSSVLPAGTELPDVEVFDDAFRRIIAAAPGQT